MAQSTQELETTLWVNRFNSECGNCKISCDPDETHHYTNLGYSEEIRNKPGCGAKYISIASHYAGMKDGLLKMRPDLKWAGYED